MPDDPSAVPVHHTLTDRLIRGPASFLSVRKALILKHNLLHLMAVWVFVDTVPTHVSLANIRVILLGRAWCGVLGRGWSRLRPAEHRRKDQE